MLLAKNKITSAAEKHTVLALLVYIIIYSIPNVLGTSSKEAPTLFNYWQLFSLFIIGIIAISLALRGKLGISKLFIVSLIMMGLTISSIITVYYATPGFISGKYIINEFVPVFLVGIFYGVLGSSKISENAFWRFLKWFVVFIIFGSIYNLMLNFSTLSAFWTANSAYDYEYSSFFENRNAFAFMVAVAITAIVYLYRRRQISRIKFGLIFSLFAFNLLLTLSRGGMLFAAVFLIVFYFQIGYRSILKLLSVMAIAGLILLSILGMSFIVSEIVRPTTGLTQRDAIHSYGLTYFKNNNTLTGSGDTIRPSLDNLFKVSSLHSTYLDILITGGILLSIFYVGIIMAVFVTSKRIRKVNADLGRFFLAVLAAFLVYSYIETATPFRISSTSATVSAFIFILPFYVKNGLTEKR